MKNLLKTFLFRNETVRRFLQGSKRRTNAFLLNARCSLYDFQVRNRSMSWLRGSDPYWPLSSELIFQYHKLEKGLCLPPPHRFFGHSAVTATLALLDEWHRHKLPTDGTIYRSATEVLRAYRARLELIPPPDSIRKELVAEIDAVLAGTPPQETLKTPVRFQELPPAALTTLETIAAARRSVRHFTGEPVDFLLVERALSVAQLSPSACNRQPWRVHFYSKQDDIDKLLDLQNGNSGFRQTIPLLAVITADMRSFFDSSERIEPILDCGLFMMSFILALQSAGLSSCCLNWCVSPQHDRLGHFVGNIPDHHTIVSFLAIGRAAPGISVPRSSRRGLGDLFVLH